MPNSISPTFEIIYLPVFLITMAMLGLGFGSLVSAMTTKYRDLTYLVAFGVQLIMYASPIIYPLSTVSDKWQFYLKLNPMTSVIHNFKAAFLGADTFDYWGMLYSFVFGVIIFTIFIQS